MFLNMKTPPLDDNHRTLLRQRLRQKINQKKLGRETKKNLKAKVTKVVKRTLDKAGVNSTHFFEAIDIIKKAEKKKNGDIRVS